MKFQWRTVLIIGGCLILSVSFLVGPRAASTQTPPPQETQPPNVKRPVNQKPSEKEQQDPNNEAGPSSESIKIDTELVQLDIRVMDKRANPVLDLAKEDFTVYEDQVKQSIESVSKEEVPLSFGIAVDTSGSMRTRLQSIIEAAQNLIKEMRPRDEAFLVQFKTEVKVVQDFTADQKKLDDALFELYASGGTALLDAIIATSGHAQQKGKERRKALIVISDGLEKNSAAKERAVMEAIKQNEVQVYLVGFIDDANSKSEATRWASKKGRDMLERLAEDSGGRAFFPKGVEEMPAIAAQIGNDLRSQYVLSYYPANERRDGTFRRVNVVVRERNGGKLIVRTRQGYYASTPQGRSETAAPPR